MNSSLSQQNTFFAFGQSVSLLFLSAIVFAIYWLRGDRDPFSKIPGPFIAKFTNFWEVYHARLGQRYIAVHKAHQVCFLVIPVNQSETFAVALWSRRPSCPKPHIYRRF